MGPTRLTPRPQAQIAAYFEGLDLVEPGLVRVPDWRPDSEIEAAPRCAMWAAIGRKP